MIVSSLKTLFVVLVSAWFSVLELLSIPFGWLGNPFTYIAKLHARSVLSICGVKIEVIGLDRVDFSKKHIYVANHASLFDIPAVIAGIPQEIRIVYKKELERIPIFGWALKYCNTYIRIDRQQGLSAIQSLDTAIEKIRDEGSVLLFAEGTRTPDGRLQAFKRGAFNMAVRAGIPIVPLTINGSYRILPKGSRRIRPGIITLILGAAVQPPHTNGKDMELELRDRVYSVIEENYDDSNKEK